MAQPQRRMGVIGVFSVTTIFCVAAFGGQGDNLPKQLLAARSLQQSGRYDSARAVLLEALSTSPQSALLLNQLGSVQQDLGQYLDAERSYLQALNASAETEGAPEWLVVKHNLATLYLDTGQYSKGERLLAELEKALPKTLHDHPASAAELLNVIASLEHVRGGEGKAEQYYWQSLALLHENKQSAGLDAALIKANIGFLRLQGRRYESAEELFGQSIRDIEVARGLEDPALIKPLINLATCENMRNESIRAESAARRATELSLKIFGNGHPVTASAMMEQATALRRLRRKRQARDLEKWARAGLRSNSKSNLSGYTVELGELARAARP